MRLATIVISLVCVAIPAHGFAKPKPKIAVAPLDGDPGNKIGDAVVAALTGKDYAVIGPKETGKDLARLDLTGELDAKATRKATTKLGVVAVIDGKVTKTGGKRFLHLEVHRRGQADAGFTVEFKTTTSKGFRRGIHDEIVKKLDGASDDPEGDDDARPAAVADDDRKRKPAAAPAEDDAPRPRKAADDDRPARTASDDGETRRKPAPAPAEDDAPRPSKSQAARPARRVADAGDDDEVAVRKRKRARSDDGGGSTLTAARVGAGAGVAQRQLSWNVRSGFTQVPPRVLTTAGSGRVDGELYPFALSDPHAGLAGLGLAASYDKTFGLSIKLPNQTVSAPINQSHYSVGVRYRLGIGESASLALGLDYARRQYVGDRSGLGSLTLDMPDVSYAAVSPGAWLRVPVSSTIAVFGGADGLLIFDAGAIQSNMSYGPATVYGLEGAAGVDIGLTKQIGLRIALEYSQIMFSFTAKGSTLANNRDGDPATMDVNGATDRSIGGTAMLCLVY